ncbi:DUF29 family protein [Runella salmonicolor]|uniref:DUF29 domain-containing protein n=1 Tax=Runella salmonicolor TaxID=2950278 RepID=A0ABT1FQ08_9BACT|nr:DUF29 family protein [Runella salmonicolor]MCP1382873.1 DUF29 domain-containing protein [Runella salmonicolor]
MEELEALRKMVEAHDYSAALALIDEMDEMAKDDKIVKIQAYIKILLIHLIKQTAEKRTTKSWKRSIANALDGIYSSNKRHRAKGFYLTPEELNEAIEDRFNRSLSEAADEAFEGELSPQDLLKTIDKEAIKKEALDLILTYEP